MISVAIELKHQNAARRFSPEIFDQASRLGRHLPLRLFYGLAPSAARCLASSAACFASFAAFSALYASTCALDFAAAAARTSSGISLGF